GRGAAAGHARACPAPYRRWRRGELRARGRIARRLQPRGPDPRRTRRAARAGGGRLNAPAFALPFDASRRLTGPNLFFESGGALLETTGIEVDEALLAGWHVRARRARAHLSWQQPGLAARRHAGGVSLALAAPPDQLFVATEVNE